MHIQVQFDKPGCDLCRLTVTYTEVVYPARISPNQGKPVTETQKLADCIYDCRTLLQQILTDGLAVLQNSKACYQQHKTGLSKEILIHSARIISHYLH